MEANQHSRSPYVRTNSQSIPTKIFTETHEFKHTVLFLYCCHVMTDIRLVGVEAQMSGVVEVFYENEWRSVCDDFWNDEDAQVACRQLGLPSDGECNSHLLSYIFLQSH